MWSRTEQLNRELIKDENRWQSPSILHFSDTLNYDWKLSKSNSQQTLEYQWSLSNHTSLHLLPLLASSCASELELLLLQMRTWHNLKCRTLWTKINMSKHALLQETLWKYLRCHLVLNSKTKLLSVHSWQCSKFFPKVFNTFSCIH